MTNLQLPSSNQAKTFSKILVDFVEAATNLTRDGLSVGAVNVHEVVT